MNSDDALREWRRKAANITFSVVLALHAPALALFLAGFGPPGLRPIRTVVVAGFLVVLSAAFLRQLDHRVRVWTLLAVLYAIAFLGVIVFPAGPWIRALPIAAPVLTIVLIGVRSARIAMGVSAGVMMLGPVVAGVPAVTRLLGVDRNSLPSIGHTWLQGTALTADMVVMMILLERFYGFFWQTLAAERRGAAERMTATRKLEREMRERRRLEHEIARTGDEERRHLGQEVHDGVCQQLAGALLRCQALELRLEHGNAPSLTELGALSSLLGDTMNEARAVAHGLWPLEPAADALAPALRALTRRTQRMSGVRCEFAASGDVLVPNAATAQHVYRIAQEALSNAVRHAHASRVSIDLRGTDDALLLKVEDDGVGLPAAIPAGGMGLRTMAFRAQLVEGALAVEPAQCRGTRVCCRVPRTACVAPEPERPSRAVLEGSTI